MKTMNENKGFTLVELIVSIALISIILILFTNLFMFSVKLLSKSSKEKISSMNASSKIENGTAPKSPNTFTINFGSNPDNAVKMPGNYLKSSDSSGEVIYKSFVPDSK